MTETDKRRWAIVVANEKGGVGKSTLALAITDKLAITGYSPVVIQIDRQKRLSAALGQDVITIASDPKAARADPGKELARFSPVLDAVTRADVNSIAEEYFRTEDIAFAALGDLSGFAIDRNRLDVGK